MIDAVKILRTCPPPEQRRGENWKRHLEKCRACRDGENHAWEGLAEHLAAFLKENQEQSLTTPGDIRQIRMNKGRWVNHDFLNPPMVLVGEIDEGRKTARGFMVCIETEVEGPGDLVVQERDTDFMDLLVETWNPVVVAIGDLDVRAGGVSRTVLADILRHAKDSSFTPAWAASPLSIRGNDDPRIKIRKIEKNTAALFSMNPLDVLFGRVSVFVEKVRPFFPDLSGVAVGRSLRETVLTFPFDETVIPAFAHGDRKTVPVVWKTMILRGDDLVNYFPCAAVAESDETVKGRRIITGRGTPPSDAGIFRFLACLELSSGELLDAVQVELEDDGFFSAEFDVADKDDQGKARPVFCAIYQQKDVG